MMESVMTDKMKSNTCKNIGCVVVTRRLDQGLFSVGYSGSGGFQFFNVVKVPEVDLESNPKRARFG